MKTQIIFLLLFCYQLTSFGQVKADLNWSETISFKSRGDYITVVGARGSQLYALSSSNSSPQYSIEVDLLVFDLQQMEVIQEFSIINNKSDQNFESLILTEENILVFTSFYDRKLGFKILSVSSYDEKTNTLGEMMRVDEVFSLEKNEAQSFRITASPNRKHVLIYHENVATSGNRIFNMKVLGTDFSTMWEKEIELNYKERMVNFEDVLLDDNLTVYLLTTLNPYGIKKSSGFGSMLNLKNSLFIYKPYEEKLKEYEFALSRNWIGSVKLKMDNEHNVLASAFYTQPNDYKMRGFVIFKIDGNSGQIVMRKMVPLGRDEMKKVDDAIDRLKDFSRMMVGSFGAYPGTSSHMNSTSTEFELKYTFASGEGMVFAVEALRRDERCTESINDQQMLVTCEKHFLYGDILLFFVDEAGTLRNITNVTKMQHAMENKNPYFSFSGAEDSSRVYLFFNDDNRNLVENEEGKTTSTEDNVALMRMSKATLNIQSFSFDGTPVNFSFSEQGGENTFYFPSDNKFIGTSELLLYSRKEKNYKFGKLLIR